MSQAERNRAAAELAMLLDAPTIGPRRAMDLLGRRGTAEQAIAALRASPSTAEPLRRFLDHADLADYLHQIERTLAMGADYLLWTDPDYPANLRGWRGRPPMLYVKGDLAGLGPRSLALVGRVDPSGDGRAAAARFAVACIAHDITVVSGLAKGIDAAAHRERWTFPMRNEVMCTLAMGIVVVEATEDCGSHI